MKRILATVLAGLLAGLLVLTWGWRQWSTPAGAPPENGASVQVRITPGMTLAAAADSLVANSLLKNRWTMVLGARATGRDRSLRAGLYELRRGRAPRDLLADLVAGPAIQVVLTIPEGLEATEVAALVQAALGCSSERFLAAADSLARREVLARDLFGSDEGVAAHDSALVAAAALGAGRSFHWSEGLLAPDTYHFGEGTGAVAVAVALVHTQVARLAEAFAGGRDGVNAGLTPMGLLTLASVVEAEARRDTERAMIAAVYTNRLVIGKRLEADPTVAYVLGRKGKRLYYRDLKVDSPYNTYRNSGLPPGPIGAPGLASLTAASAPDRACRALYFVSDGAGGHVFSRTHGEHEAAVARFRATRSKTRSAAADTASD